MGNIDYTKNPLVKKFIEVEASENKIKNIFLFAGGGYGKTTAMCCLFKYLLDKASNGEKIVPIYIDVKKLNFNETNPIISYIHSKYSGSDTKESDVKNLFSDQAPEFSKKYTYYVLIDGLNETSDRNKSNLIDIISVMTEISNVRFVVSSRIKEIFDKAPFCTFEMQKLNEEQIKDYLDKNFGEKYNEQTEVKRINKSLIEILQIPMFMKTFSKTYDKRSPYPDIYDEKTVRKADILDSYVQKILLNLKERTNSYDNNALEFVINFYLPSLAFQMAEENALELDSEIVDEKLDLEYFATFFKGTRKKKIEALIKNDGFMPECICSENFALINDNDGNYSFVHQIWRDFFAAKHIINCMNAEKLDELEISVDENIRQFVGELVREYVDKYKYSKKPAYKSICENGKVKFIDNPDTRKCECDFEEKDNLETSESPIEYFMQQHNMNSIKPISSIAIRNLIEIMKTSRNNHITADYSNLDLCFCVFLNNDLSNSLFYKSFIVSKSFIPIGHKGMIKNAYVTHGGKYVFSLGNNNIYIWNTYLETKIDFTSFFIGINDLSNISVINSNENSFLIKIENNQSYLYYTLDCKNSRIINVDFRYDYFDGFGMQIAKRYAPNFFYDNDGNCFTVEHKYEVSKSLYIVSKNNEIMDVVDSKKFGEPMQYDCKSDTLVCINNSDIILWSLKKLIIKNIFAGYSYPSTNIVDFFDVNSQALCAQGYCGGRVCIFDSIGRIVSNIYTNGDEIIDVKNIEETDIIVVGVDSYIEFYNWKTRKLLYVIDEFQDIVCNITFFKNNEVMVVTSGCDDYEYLRIFELNYNKNIKCKKINLGNDFERIASSFFNIDFDYDEKNDCIYICDKNIYDNKNSCLLVVVNCSDWTTKRFGVSQSNVFRHFKYGYMQYYLYNNDIYSSIISSKENVVQLIKNEGEFLVVESEFSSCGYPIKTFFYNDSLWIIEYNNEKLFLYSYNLIKRKYSFEKKVYASEKVIKSLRDYTKLAEKKKYINNFYLEFSDGQVKQTKIINYFDLNYDIKNNVFTINQIRQNIDNDIKFDVLPNGISKCDFSTVIQFDMNNKSDFFNTLYQNGAIVPKEYEPQSVPLE